MARTTYYEILGVSPRESTRGIQEAFRKLAKQHHPDYAGTQGTPFFQTIVEAYEVLSDPDKRAAYNRSLPRSFGDEGARRQHEGTHIPIHHEPRRRRAPVEDLVEPLGDSPRRQSPPRSFGTWELEAILSPEEARWGTVATIDLPFRITCPICRGSGREWFFPCQGCGQLGMVSRKAPVRLAIPPGVRHHELVDIPLNRIGLTGQRLRLHITIAS